MNDAQREALRDIAELGYNLQPEVVNMDIWWCRTVGCLLGHGIKNLPSVQALGVMLAIYDEVYKQETPCYKSLTGAGAISAILGLDYAEINGIFNSRTTIEASNKILDLLGVEHI